MKKTIIIEPDKSLKNRNAKNAHEKERVVAYCRVSTDDEEQLKSCESQVKYYTDLIKSNEAWEFAGIYVDEAVSGFKKSNRLQFLKMIDDAMAGKFDRILVKSISRFARNALDALSTIKKLNSVNVPVKFEEENIDSMGDVILLTILTSMAEQELINTSKHVYKGLTMKMDRGEIIGFSRCLGYYYDKESKKIEIVEEEAELVREIFELYISGIGGRAIAKKINLQGYLTIKGNKWTESGVLGVIKNEKYVGDLLQGKTVTVITDEKKRVQNNGIKNKYLLQDVHEPIVTREVFQQAQEILVKRKVLSKDMDGILHYDKLSRQYPFSCKLKCGYCGNNLSRRTWHSGTTHEKTMWQCVKATKKGKKYCPSSKGISEKDIETAFVEAYNLMFDEHKDVLNTFIERIEKTLVNDDNMKGLKRAKNQIETHRTRLQILVDKNIDGLIDNVTYQIKADEIIKQIDKLENEIARLQNCIGDENNIKNRIIKFKEVLSSNQILTHFDSNVFESIIDSVIVGGFDDEGNKDPYKLIFVFKDGIIDGKVKLNINENVCSNVTYVDNKTYSHVTPDTRGDGCSVVPTKTE